MTTINLEDMVFTGCHGCTLAEKGRQREFGVSMVLEMDLLPVIQSDRPADTTDWTPVRDIAEKVITGTPRNTVETLAGRIVYYTLQQFPKLDAVTVVVTKPDEWDDKNGVPGTTVRFTRCILGRLVFRE